MDHDPIRLMHEAEAFLRDVVVPRASAMDRDPDALRVGLEGLCQRGLMALRRPIAYGGPEMPEPLFRDFQEEVARASGALAFLQTQHQSAVSMMARSENQDLKERTLPFMADGTRLVGIGFSQLRRPGPPMLRAEPCAEGCRLTGHVPWVTGWTFYSEFLAGASLPDGSAIFGLVPLENRHADGGSIRVSEPMRLAAMEAAMTVQVELTDWLLPAGDTAFTRPPGWIHKNDLINIALQGFFAVGCARAGLDGLRAAFEKKGDPAIGDALDLLNKEVATCRQKLAEAQSVGEDTSEERLALRAWAIELAVRCAHAAITATGGSANAADHPAQRVYREALVYTVSAQTAPIMRATLARLTRG